MTCMQKISNLKVIYMQLINTHTGQNEQIHVKIYEKAYNYSFIFYLSYISTFIYSFISL